MWTCLLSRSHHDAPVHPNAAFITANISQSSRGKQCPPLPSHSPTCPQFHRKSLGKSPFLDMRRAGLPSNTFPHQVSVDGCRCMRWASKTQGRTVLPISLHTNEARTVKIKCFYLFHMQLCKLPDAFQPSLALIIGLGGQDTHPIAVK